MIVSTLDIVLRQLYIALADILSRLRNESQLISLNIFNFVGIDKVVAQSLEHRRRGRKGGRERWSEGRGCGGGWRFRALKYFLSRQHDLLTDCQWAVSGIAGRER